MKWDFDGRIALVTGAASGIGAATATAFANAGAHVIAVDLHEAGLTSLVAQNSANNGHIHPVVADISDTDALQRVLQGVIRDLGGLHHIVNCAASFVAAGAGATSQDWDRALTVNVAASAMLTAFGAKHMSGNGTVVNIASISAHIAQPERWTYNATKAAIVALTRGQAMDLAKEGIRVNAVSPGWIWTAEVAKAADGDRAKWEPVWGKYHMLERLGEASEVADAVLFLSSSASSFITGTELMVDGGYCAMGPEGLGETAHFAGSN